MWKIFRIGNFAGRAWSWMWGKKAKAASLVGDAVGLSAKASKSSALRTVARSVWRVADYGITGYAIYDLTRGGSSDSTPEEKVVFHNRLMNAILPNEVLLALSLEVKDASAVAGAFRRAGSQLISDDMDDDSLAGFAYLAFAEYIRKVPTGSMRSGEDITTILASEYIQMIESSGIMGEEEGGSIEDVKEFFENMDLSSAPIEIIRRYDFLCFVLEQVLDSETALNNDFGGSNNAPLINVVGGQRHLN